jgi:antirestriction protein
VNKAEIKIFVVCMSAYKNGYLHGAWINANQDVDMLYAEVQNMLAQSPMLDAELFEIRDYRGFGSVCIDRNTSLEIISALVSVIHFVYE